MRPCSTTLRENKRKMHNSTLAVKKDFYKEYDKHIAGGQIVSECAKIYILENYKRVKSWTDLNIEITDNSKKKTEYYNYRPRERVVRNVQPRADGKRPVKSVEPLSDFFREMEMRDKQRHNPIKTFTNAVLDPTDGDFSVTINGKDHLWLHDECVIVIADFIEKQLLKQGKDARKRWVLRNNKK